MNFFLAIFFLVSAYSAPTQNVSIPMGMAVVCDGKLSENEWSAADSLFIDIDETKKVKIKLQHDGGKLYAAFFVGKSNGMNIYFPEVLIDVKNSKSKAWEKGQWWLHMSGTDCENEGAPSVYNNCNATGNGWQAQPNFENGKPFPEFVEMEISFSKLGLQWEDKEISVGMAFDVTNTMNSWNFWPAGALLHSPATWGKALFTIKKE